MTNGACTDDSFLSQHGAHAPWQALTEQQERMSDPDMMDHASRWMDGDQAVFCEVAAGRSFISGWGSCLVGAKSGGIHGSYSVLLSTFWYISCIHPENDTRYKVKDKE